MENGETSPGSLEQRIAAMLTEAESAHGAYEASELGGQRDEQWPRWYAAYLIEHNFLALFPKGVARFRIGEHLDNTLTQLDQQYRAQYSTEAEHTSWQDYYSRQLASLGAQTAEGEPQ